MAAESEANRFIELEKLLLSSLGHPDETLFAGLKSSEPIHQTCTGSYVEAMKSDIFQSALGSGRKSQVESAIADFYKTNLKTFLEENPNDEERQLIVLCIGICCLQLFTQNNFCGPFIGPEPQQLLPGLQPDGVSAKEIREKAFKEIVLDMEGVYNLLQYPEYLIVSRVIFFDLKNDISGCLSVNWWALRCGLIHQKVADEHSPLIYDSLCESIANENAQIEVLLGQHRDLSALYNLEVGHFHLYYQHVGHTRKYFEEARNVLCLEFNLTGALGKRTKWQEKDISQLVLQVSFSGKSLAEGELPGPLLLPGDLPKDVLLDDDTRLHQIKYIEIDDDIIPNLRPIEQMCLMSQLILLRKSTSHDEQLVEVTKAHLVSILQYPKCWSLQLSALFLRCKTEWGEMRAMQRSLEQLEELLATLQRTEPSRFQRLKLIHSSLLMPHWELQHELAQLLMRVGSVKTALEIFERLHLWDDVIICYNDLQMRQRSAKIVRELLEKGETPKLLCLLGDATDDIECYNKAWVLSNNKSSRAQRCLGNYYYVRKEYTKAIEHFEISLTTNTLQFMVWQRMAFSALQIDDWETCAKAYRRCSVLEPDSFECWNNLSQAYLKLNQPYRAWKTLKEALRGRTNSWRLWDNYMTVSTTLGYIQQALHAYNQILLYKEKHVDTEILGRAVISIIDNKSDPDGNEMNRQRKKCTDLIAKLAREVPQNPELWFLYAELLWETPESTPEKRHTAMQYYRKSVAAETQKANWDKSTETCLLVIMRCLKLSEVLLKLSEESDSTLSVSDMGSVLMLFKSCVSGVKRGQTSFESGEIVPGISSAFVDLEEQLGVIERMVKSKREL